MEKEARQRAQDELDAQPCPDDNLFTAFSKWMARRSLGAKVFLLVIAVLMLLFTLQQSPLYSNGLADESEPSHRRHYADDPVSNLLRDMELAESRRRMKDAGHGTQLAQLDHPGAAQQPAMTARPRPTDDHQEGTMAAEQQTLDKKQEKLDAQLQKLADRQTNLHKQQRELNARMMDAGAAEQPGMNDQQRETMAAQQPEMEAQQRAPEDQRPTRTITREPSTRARAPSRSDAAREQKRRAKEHAQLREEVQPLPLEQTEPAPVTEPSHGASQPNFKVGERVSIREPLATMQIGHKGTVTNIQYYPGRSIYTVKFDDIETAFDVQEMDLARA